MRETSPSRPPAGCAPPRVVGVLGASGGLGGSTLTCALATRRPQRGGVAVCVEADRFSGHLDVTACVEHLPGLRWPDLSELSGDVDGPRLLRALPQEDGVAVLSGSCGSSRSLLPSVLEALLEPAGLVVVDMGRCWEGLTEAASLCDLLVVVAGLSVRRLADSGAAVSRLPPGCPEVGLVTRGKAPRDGLSEAVAAHLDLPLLGQWPDDPRIATDAERGVAPGSRWRSRQLRFLDRVLEAIHPGSGPARDLGPAPAAGAGSTAGSTSGSTAAGGPREHAAHAH